MTPIRSIIVATDFSASALHATHRAARLARQFGARLAIVHVLNPSRFKPLRNWFAPPVDLESALVDAQAKLRGLAAELMQVHALQATIDLRTGNTVEELAQASAHANLVVMGQRRRGPLAERVLGSTARQLVEACRRPMLAVKQAAVADYSRLLVPIDLSPGSAAAAVAAGALAPEGRMQIFHAYEFSGNIVPQSTEVRDAVIRDEQARREAGLVARMRRSIARIGLDSRNMSFALGRGSRITATLRQAEVLRADLIVAATSRRGRSAASVLDSVNGLLARSSCDMLIVPGGVPEARPVQGPALWPPTADAARERARAAREQGWRAPSWPSPLMPTATFEADRGRPPIGANT